MDKFQYKLQYIAKFNGYIANNQHIHAISGSYTEIANLVKSWALNRKLQARIEQFSDGHC